MATMSIHISLCVMYFFYTINSNPIPYVSIPQQIESITTRSGTSLTIKSHQNDQTNDSNDEFRWNGGIILTSESNKVSKKGRSETTIASTRCGNLLFVGFNSATMFCRLDENDSDCPALPVGFENGGTAYAVSLNRGKTWKYMYSPPSLGSNIFTRGDPWMSMGGKGAPGTEELLYFSSIALNKSNIDFAWKNAIGLVVHVARIIYQDDDPSKKAIDFEWIRASLIPKLSSIDFLDKEAIAAHPFDSSKAYVSLTNINLETNDKDIEVYSTYNAGESWQGPNVLWADQGSILTAKFSVPVVGANGNVYTVWYEREVSENFIRTQKFRFNKLNSNKTIVINPEFTFLNPIEQIPVAHSKITVPIQPTIAIFTTVYKKNENYFNRIIIAYEYALTDEVNTSNPGFIDDNDSLLNSINFGISYSDDEGDTWHFIDPFTELIPEKFVKRKFPSVSVSGNGKSVNIAYIEVVETKMDEICLGALKQRTSFYHSIANHYYIHSDDGGVTWSDPIQLNEFPVDWCISGSNLDPNYGDYMLSISDERGGIQVAGQTNGFSVIEVIAPRTAPDVIYFYSKRERCEETKDCFSGKKKKDRKITCSMNVKYNNKDDVNKYCCVQHMGSCQNDNDCCGGENSLQCHYFENDYKCVNTKQWRAIKVSNAMGNIKQKLLGYLQLGDRNVNVEIQLPWILIAIGMCCMAMCCIAPCFIWMQMIKE